MVKVARFSNSIIVLSIWESPPNFGASFADGKKLSHMVGTKESVCTLAYRPSWLYTHVQTGKQNIRDNLILQPAEEQDRDLGDFGQRILASPVLVTKANDVLSSWEDAGKGM